MGVLVINRPDAGVVLIQLNRSERRNAMTSELTSAWRGALAQLGNDRELRVVVVTGFGLRLALRRNGSRPVDAVHLARHPSGDGLDVPAV